MGYDKTKHANEPFNQRIANKDALRSNILKMCRFCSLFTMSGWTEALNGPTFPDLRLIIQEDLDRSSWLFTVASFGFLVGSAAAGFLFRLKRRNVMFAVVIICFSTAVGVVPWCPYFYLMLIAKFFVGVFASVVNAGCIAEVASMWEENTGFYMQILHFCFSLGGMISPLMARPFLAPEDVNDENSVNETCNSSEQNLEQTTSVGLGRGNVADNSKNSYNTSIDVVTCTNFTDISYKHHIETKVMYAYLITAGILVIISIAFITACIQQNMNETRRPSSKTCLRSKRSQPIPKWQKVLLLAAVSLLLFLYVGAEMTFVGFLSTFTVLQMQWSKSTGALATSVFWICFGLGRFVGIWLSKLLKTATFLFLFPSFLTISHGILLLSASVDNATLVMVSVGMIGASMSVIFASVITWASENITIVTGHISALFIASCSVGVMLFPLLFGYTMDRLSPKWFIYLLLGESVLWLILFSVTYIFSRRILAPPSFEIEMIEKQQFEIAE